MRKPQDVATRFWSKAFQPGPDECWTWMRGTFRKGYGEFRWKGRSWLAHRVAYLLTHGVLTPGLNVLHTCDNPPCVNPAHLYEGTCQQNSDDMVARNRQARGDNVPYETRSRGDRHWARLCPEKLARGDRNGSRTRPESRPRGEGNHFAKITEKEVIRIREMRQSGLTFKGIADKVNLAPNTVFDIVKRRTWKHIL